MDLRTGIIMGVTLVLWVPFTIISGNGVAGAVVAGIIGTVLAGIVCALVGG